ncbi:hypothetical protein SteCoe_4006 [Stentor coeruleus]|uniref:Histidine kinase n=1 Tax=Stentor coeruleus TaxID=5963 RepID=A0A1R2BY74_9CILI|nr:hypothetical protein SteCoe_17928 [Stentor coeruleus]OMJ93066.1 hypothetical protein SteCoe_4006 [Stentor coeruleus]
MEQEKAIQDTLLEYINISASKRIQFVQKIIGFIGVITFTLEMAAFDAFENIQHKLITLSFYFAPWLINQFGKKWPSSLPYFSFILGEFYNIGVVYICYFIFPEYSTIFCLMGPYISSYYQTYLLKGATISFLFSVKQTFLWISPGLYLSKIPKDNIPMLLTHIFLLILLQSISYYFDYQKALEICKSKIEAKNLSTQMSLILETIPDYIMVISKNMIKLFDNTSLGVLMGDKDLAVFLKEFYYKSKFDSKLEKDADFYEDIKNTFNFHLNTSFSFGIIEYSTELIEWNGKIVQWDEREALIISGRNVKKIIRLEKEKAENEYRSMLVNTVSHELRTPTNAIMTIASLMKQSESLSVVNKERLDIIIGSCSFQISLINDLLDYAQIVAGCLKICTIPFVLSQLLDDCINYIEIQLGDEIKFFRDFRNIPEIIITDPNRLKQIILNLLSNARKFTRKGSITLKATYKFPQLYIKCKDTGIGMPSEKKSKLFTLFGKLDDSSIANPQGVGLGLMISNMLVKKLGGSNIIVDSSIGKGSKFSFSIPAELPDINICDIPDEKAKVSIPFFLVKSLSNRKEILVVDDIFFNIQVYMHLFKDEGIKCEYALNGEEAVNLIKNKIYSCILMDCEMPILDGWETTKKLHELKLKGIIKKLPPIIGATAHSNSDIREKCLSSGMDDLIIKPCEKEVLVKKILHWIQE